MKVYKKLIRPMIGYPGQNGEPKCAPIEYEEKWYPEEDQEKLIAKYKHQESTFEHLIFEEKYEEVEIPELVRCKDCKHGAPTIINGVWLSVTCADVDHRPEWFCADGERK